MPSPKIELFLFGNPELRVAGQSHNFDTRKALALLAYLVVSGHSQSRNTLAALFWSEFDQVNARASLRRTLSTLHKGIEGAGLEVDRETINLAKDSSLLWSDVGEFSQKLKIAKNYLLKNEKPNSEVASKLEQAVALWRGEFMQGFSLRDAPEFEEWQGQIAESFRRDMSWSLEKLTQYYVSVRDFEKALNCSQHWLMLDSLNEEAHQQIMKLYFWNGQPSLALKQYQECVQILERELGVPPLESTIALYEAIKERSLKPLPPLVPSTSIPSTNYNLATTIVESTSLPLVGREVQWHELETAAQIVLKQGRGRLIGVEGEAGVGKTRLVEEFLRRKQEEANIQVTKISCFEGEAEIAFVVVSTLLRNLLSQLSDKARLETISLEWRNEAARLAPELGTNLGVSSSSLDSPAAQSHFYEGLRQTVFALCGKPNFLFFDDLQWIDGASLDFLAYLTRRLADLPICVIISWRSGTVSTQPKFAQLLSTAKRQNQVTLTNLNRLKQSEVVELVKAGLPGSTNKLAQSIYTETEGLPFFVVEYIEAYQGGFFETELSEKTGELFIPGGVRDLLESRLRSITETAHQLLQSAAVIGQVFDFNTLQAVSGRSETETITALEELTSASLIVELAQNKSELRYDFCHEKLRKFVYETISPARRRLLHRRVAKVFTKRKANKELLYGQIAYHYRLAGNEMAAAENYRLAGDYARALFANREALNYYQTALALGYQETFVLYEASGDIYILLGEYMAALHQYQLAMQKAGENARLQYKIGKTYFWRGEWELSSGQFEIALALAEGDEALAAQIRTDWSLALHHLHRYEEARSLAEEALKQAIQATDKRVQAQAKNVLGLLAGHRGETGAAIDHLIQSLALSEEVGEQTLQAAALNNLARVNQLVGEYVKAIELTKAALAIVSIQDDRHRQAALLSNLGDLYQAIGQTEKAQDSVKQSVNIYTEIGIEAGSFQPGIWMLTDW